MANAAFENGPKLVLQWLRPRMRSAVVEKITSPLVNNTIGLFFVGHYAPIICIEKKVKLHME
jgi:hypothetical protein